MYIFPANNFYCVSKTQHNRARVAKFIYHLKFNKFDSFDNLTKIFYTFFLSPLTRFLHFQRSSSTSKYRSEIRFFKLLCTGYSLVVSGVSRVLLKTSHQIQHYPPSFQLYIASSTITYISYFTTDHLTRKYAVVHRRSRCFL